MGGITTDTEKSNSAVTEFVNFNHKKNKQEKEIQILEHSTMQENKDKEVLEEFKMIGVDINNKRRKR